MTTAAAMRESPVELDGGLPLLGHLAAFLRDPLALLAWAARGDPNRVAIDGERESGRRLRRR